jgi:uncharacterized membrane protein
MLILLTIFLTTIEGVVINLSLLFLWIGFVLACNKALFCFRIVIFLFDYVEKKQASAPEPTFVIDDRLPPLCPVNYQSSDLKVQSLL